MEPPTTTRLGNEQERKILEWETHGARSWSGSLVESPPHVTSRRQHGGAGDATTTCESILVEGNEHNAS